MFLRERAPPPRNVSTNRTSSPDLFTDFTGIDFETIIYLFVKPRLLMKNIYIFFLDGNIDFSNRQRLRVSKRNNIYIKVMVSNALVVF